MSMWEHLTFVFFIWKFLLFTFHFLCFIFYLNNFTLYIYHLVNRGESRSKISASGVSGHWHLPTNPFILSTVQAPIKSCQPNLSKYTVFRKFVHFLFGAQMFTPTLFTRCTLHCTVQVKNSRNRESLPTRGDSLDSRLLQFSNVELGLVCWCQGHCLRLLVACNTE